MHFSGSNGSVAANVFFHRWRLPLELVTNKPRSIEWPIQASSSFGRIQCAETNSLPLASDSMTCSHTVGLFPRFHVMSWHPSTNHASLRYPKMFISWRVLMQKEVSILQLFLTHLATRSLTILCQIRHELLDTQEAHSSDKIPRTTKMRSQASRLTRDPVLTELSGLDRIKPLQILSMFFNVRRLLQFHPSSSFPNVGIHRPVLHHVFAAPRCLHTSIRQCSFWIPLWVGRSLQFLSMASRLRLAWATLCFPSVPQTLSLFLAALTVPAGPIPPGCNSSTCTGLPAVLPLVRAVAANLRCVCDFRRINGQDVSSTWSQHSQRCGLPRLHRNRSMHLCTRTISIVPLAECRFVLGLLALLVWELLEVPLYRKCLTTPTILELTRRSHHIIAMEKRLPWR